MIVRAGAALAALLVASCASAPAPVEQPPAVSATRTTGGPPIPATGPCPAPTWDWSVQASGDLGEFPMFSVTGKIRLQHRQWAELREEYPLSPPAGLLHMVRLNVRTSPTNEPAGERVMELRTSRPASSTPATVIVTCGSQVVARFEGVRWEG